MPIRAGGVVSGVFYAGSDTFIPFAVTEDITPNNFNLGGPITGALLGSVHEANSFIVSGADDGIDLDINVTNGEYRIDGGAWTSAAGVVQNGQTVEFRVTASNSYLSAVVGNLDINGISSDFNVITQVEPSELPGLAFFVRDAVSDQLTADTTIDIRVSTAKFNGTELLTVMAHPIDSSGYLNLPLPGGVIGLQVFVSGTLANGKYIAGNTGILDLNSLD